MMFEPLTVRSIIKHKMQAFRLASHSSINLSTCTGQTMWLENLLQSDHQYNLKDIHHLQLWRWSFWIEFKICRELTANCRSHQSESKSDNRLHHQKGQGVIHQQSKEDQDYQDWFESDRYQWSPVCIYGGIELKLGEWLREIR